MPRLAPMVATWMAVMLLLSATPARAEEIKVIASAAVKEVLLELVPAFEKSRGHTVTPIWAGTEAITKRIQAGELADVVVIAAPNIDRLIAEGRLVARSRVDVAKSGVGVAVRAGLPKPDITSAEAVKQAALAARSVAYSSGPSGFYIAELFKRMGIAEHIKDKVKQTPSGVQVAELLARGEADLGFQQMSELLHAKGIHYLGPLPDDIQHITVFTGAVHSSAAAPDPASELLRFLTAPEADAAIRKTGMAPGSR
jgi:molybdate transport system substrate-binding protein